MHYRLYFDESSGKIRGKDNCPEDHPPMYPNAKFIKIAREPDYDREIVDPISHEIRPMTSAECLELNGPSKWELRVYRDQELLVTDWRESQPTWAVYRQALRDLPNAGDVWDMLNAWPLRPDGSDAIAVLRRAS